MEEADSDGGLSHDSENEAFWRQMRDILKTALDLLKGIAEQAGVDLDAPISKEYEETQDRLYKETEEHRLVRQAMGYRRKVGKWLESEELKAQLGHKDAGAKLNVEDLRNIEEVIVWYHTLICAKISRAVREELRGWPSILEDMPRDSDGSAKVALISIDRSIAAWWKMRKHFPHQKDRILDFLACLDSLRRAVEEAFPKARSFVRPGFDEV